jgi:colanic acid/amylovoran biosynthesis glycosyltransferase
MVPKKGHIVALRALAHAAGGLPPGVVLRLVGDGPERPGLEREAAALGIADRAVFMGSLPRSGFLAQMDRSHIYMQPSLEAPDGDTEGGAPTALLEAQACGLPVLASRHADIPFVVREHDSALLSDEGDAEGLAANMVRIAAAPQTWGSMGRAGRAHVEAHHDAAALATDLEILYATMAETGRVAGATGAR